MTPFAVSGMITPLELEVVVFVGLTFVISSVGSGFQNLVKTNLDNNPVARRRKGAG